MKKHLQIGNWSHFSGEARQPNGDPRLITTDIFLPHNTLYLNRYGK